MGDDHDPCADDFESDAGNEPGVLGRAAATLASPFQHSSELEKERGSFDRVIAATGWSMFGLAGIVCAVLQSETIMLCATLAAMIMLYTQVAGKQAPLTRSARVAFLMQAFTALAIIVNAVLR